MVSIQIKNKEVSKENDLFLGSTNSISKVKYDEINEFVEKLSKIIYFVVMKVSVLVFAMPRDSFCSFVYITSDLGPNAFELPFPIW